MTKISTMEILNFQAMKDGPPLDSKAFPNFEINRF